MYHHIKKLMYTVNVGTPDPRFGNMLLEQFGGANGELAAMVQYSRSMPQEHVATNEVLEVIAQHPGVTLGQLLETYKMLGALPATELLLEEGKIIVATEQGQDGVVKRFYPVPMVQGMG
jgi:Manganese containing catalase